MKKIIILTLALTLLIMCVACKSKNTKPLTIWQVSDIHYVAEELITDRDYFTYVVENSDGKVTNYVKEITLAFVDKALEEKPDAIIFSGDLALNGAPVSHRELVALLKPLQDAGIQCLVIPGNHDVYRQAYRFLSDTVEEVESSTPDVFKEIYSSFGYDSAHSKAPDTFSYITYLNDQFAVLMLDCNSASTGSVSADTIQWMETVLKEANEKGAYVMSVTHQNLSVQNPRFTFGYVVNNTRDIYPLFEQYNVTLNLCGHLHCQHLISDNGLTDIALSSLSVTPNQYAVIHVDSNNHLDYDTVQLHVSEYAKKAGLTDENLLNFEEYSGRIFDGSNSRKFLQYLDMANVSDEDRELMADVAKTLNRGYFAGTTGEINQIGLKLWEEHSDLPAYGYLKTIMDDLEYNHTHYQNY